VSEPLPWVDLADSIDHPAVQEAITGVLKSGWLVGGPEVEALEEEIAAWMNRPHGVAVASGTSALELALAALDIGPGDEVIVPAVSFLATVGAVLSTGATPVVVDVLRDGPWIDPDAAEAAVTDQTALVMPVHLYGSRAPALRLGIPVLDDACQAVYRGGPAVGICTALSFYPTKVLGGLGEGGMVLTQDENLASRIRRLRQHGCDASGTVVESGGTNARLSAMLAAVLRARMPQVEKECARRREIADLYDSVIGHPVVRRDVNSSVSVYAFLHPKREMVAAQLQELGIPTAVYYPRFVHDHPAYRSRVRVPHLLPNALRFCRQTLALPCHGGMSDSDVSRVVDALESVL